MKSIALHAPGDASVLQPYDAPMPKPGPHDLLVKVEAAACNPVDYKVRNSNFANLPLPLILGYDVAGTVAGMGPEVTGFGEGDPVYGSPSIGRNGANAEYVLLDARTAAPKPVSLSYVEAAALPLVVLTAWESLHDRARIQSGQTILIHAGAGGVGHVAIQLAKAQGCRVLTTAGRPESIALCQQLGADRVINYHEEDFVEVALEESTDGHGLPVVYDTVGGDTFTQSLQAVGLQGQLVTIVNVPQDAPVDSLKYKSATLHLEFMGIANMHGLNPQHHGQILRDAADMVDQGTLKPIVSHTFPMADLAAAHAQQESGRTLGKIVLTPEFD
ncbi:MAG: zinc-binding dehydrogenase [Planctomycetota bacterium]